MADIFISYKKEDRKVTEALAAALEAEGLSVWWDNALNPKAAWDSIIEQEIAAARKVLVLWSPRAVKSDWVRSEAHYAQDHGKLVPVKIEECTLPLAFMLRQAVDLSDHKFEKSNPEWERLLEWIAEEHADAPEPAHPADAPAAAAAPRADGEGWLGPKKRPAMAFGLAGLIVVGAAGFSFMGGGNAFGDLPQPDVIVDTFDVRSDALPASFAASLADEMSTDFSTSSRISPTPGDGTRVLDAYQLSGNIETDEEKIRLFARLFSPGIDTPILTTRIETDREYEDDAARILGSKIARLTRCVATASDSTGSEIVRLPEAAIKPWAKFCQQSTIDSAAVKAKIATLEEVVAAAPDFANGWANLAEMRLWEALGAGNEADATLASATEAADRALALDDTTAKAIAIKALVALGIYGDLSGETRRAPFKNIEEWDRLARRSVEVRQSDCGCEGPQYSSGLQAIGQLGDAISYMREAVDADPRNVNHLRDFAYVLAYTGRYDASMTMLDRMQELEPSAKLEGRRFQYALVNKRPQEALDHYRAALDGAEEDPRVVAMLEAFASGEQSRIDAQIAPLLEDPRAGGGSRLVYLALAGKTDAALEALDEAYDRGGPNIFRTVWIPALEDVRALPGFAEMVREAGLIDYWKESGEAPDLCRSSRNKDARYCAAI